MPKPWPEALLTNNAVLTNGSTGVDLRARHAPKGMKLTGHRAALIARWAMTEPVARTVAALVLTSPQRSSVTEVSVNIIGDGADIIAVVDPVQELTIRVYPRARHVTGVSERRAR